LFLKVEKAYLNKKTVENYERIRDVYFENRIKKN